VAWPHPFFIHHRTSDKGHCSLYTGSSRHNVKNTQHQGNAYFVFKHDAAQHFEASVNPEQLKWQVQREIDE